MGKGSAPPPPDYTGAAKEQAAASRELTDVQNWANRPTQNTPWGSTSWSAQAGTDPATGKQVTQWTQNTSLNPELQKALNDQLAIQSGKSNLAQGFMGRVAGEFSQPFDWNGLPQPASPGRAPNLQGSTNDFAGGMNMLSHARPDSSGQPIGRIGASPESASQGDMSMLSHALPSGSGQPIGSGSMPPAASLGLAPSLRGNIADYSTQLNTSVDPMTRNLQTGFSLRGPQMGMDTMSDQVQRGLATGDNPALPQVDSGFRDQVAGQLFERMQPVHDYQTRSLETRLANQGLRPGSEAYNRAMGQLGQQQAMERFNALDQSGNEAQRLFGMQMGARQQAFNEDVGSGQFSNQATGQAFNQGLQAFNFGNQAQNQAYNQMMGMAGLNNQANQQAFNQNLQAAQFGNQAAGQGSALAIARQQAMNQAAQQQFGMNQQAAEFQNRLRQQAIAEQMQRRGMSLNEMNALLSGQQVTMPTMPSFNTAQRSETPQLMDAMGRTYDAQLGAYNAQQAGMNNLLSAGAQLGSAAFMFSDRRLKSDIKRVGTHAIGVGIYEYTMMGMPQRGVIAQEVQAVRPDLVKRHANGFLMVNYGGL